MFGTEANSAKKIGPRFYVGINQCKVEKIEIKKSSTARVRLIFHLFGPKITQEGFKAWEKEKGSGEYYEGQCGSVVTSWFDPSSKEEVGKVWTRTIFPMLKCAGVYEAFGQLVNENTSLEDTVGVLSNLLVNDEVPFVYMNFGGEEYERPGKDFPGYNLFFRGFASDEAASKKLTVGTMKKLTTQEESTAQQVGDNDMPF